MGQNVTFAANLMVTCLLSFENGMNATPAELFIAQIVQTNWNRQGGLLRKRSVIGVGARQSLLINLKHPPALPPIE